MYYPYCFIFFFYLNFKLYRSLLVFTVMRARRYGKRSHGLNQSGLVSGLSLQMVHENPWALLHSNDNDPLGAWPSGIASSSAHLLPTALSHAVGLGRFFEMGDLGRHSLARADSTRPGKTRASYETGTRPHGR